MPPRVEPPKTFEELAALVKQMKEKAAAPKPPRTKPAKLPPVAKPEPPPGFGPDIRPALSPTAFLQQRVRGCFEEVTMIGVQRAPLLGDPWRTARILERRMLACIDAIVVHGPPGDRDDRSARPRCAPQGSVACLRDRDDPRVPLRPGHVGHGGAGLRGLRVRRSATRRAAGGGAEGRATPLPAAAAAHLPFGPRSRPPRPRHRRARVPGNGDAGRAGASWERRAAGRGGGTAVARPDAGIPAFGPPSTPPSSDRRHRSGSRRGWRWSSARDYRAVGSLRDALDAEAEDEAGSAASLLGIVAGPDDAKLLLERAVATPTRASVAAVGWAGSKAAMPALMKLLQHKDEPVVLAAAYALDRMTNAGLYEDAIVEAEEIMVPDMPEPDLGEKKPPPLAKVVSDPRDMPGPAVDRHAAATVDRPPPMGGLVEGESGELRGEASSSPRLPVHALHLVARARPVAVHTGRASLAPLGARRPHGRQRPLRHPRLRRHPGGIGRGLGDARPQRFR